jgi:polysaccharide pyruvyl transferase WcaK-like protein
MVISARMHALILALTYGSKIVTYKISDKLIAFDDIFGENFELLKIQEHINWKIQEVLNG